MEADIVEGKPADQHKEVVNGNRAAESNLFVEDMLGGWHILQLVQEQQQQVLVWLSHWQLFELH